MLELKEVVAIGSNYKYDSKNQKVVDRKTRTRNTR